MVSLPQSIAVLLADPSDVIRAGLRDLPRRDPRFSVLDGTPAGSVAEAERLQPDLIIFDPVTGDTIDQATTAELHRVAPSSRLVIFTSAFTERSFAAARLSRVHGYFVKDFGARGASLLDALAGIARTSAVVIGPANTEYFWSQPVIPSTTNATAASLTQRERVILQLLLQQLTDQEIARELSIAVRTVETHIHNISAKLGAKTRVHLGMLAAGLRIS